MQNRIPASGRATDHAIIATMTTFDTVLDWVGHQLARHIRKETPGDEPFVPSDPEFAAAHAAAGRRAPDRRQQQALHRHQVPDAIHLVARRPLRRRRARPAAGGGEPHTLIEVLLGEGCVSAPLSKYDRFHTRICRPVGLTDADREDVIGFMVSRLGTQYDMRNVFDLARYLLPTPPVPARWRRRMIALGSGEPTRTICSTLIAEAFGRVHYPILPRIERIAGAQRGHQRFSRQRDPAHPPLQPVRAGRLRPVALLPDRQADHRGRLQLQGPDLGTRAGAGRGRTGKAPRVTPTPNPWLFIPSQQCEAGLLVSCCPAAGANAI